MIRHWQWRPTMRPSYVLTGSYSQRKHSPSEWEFAIALDCESSETSKHTVHVLEDLTPESLRKVRGLANRKPGVFLAWRIFSYDS